MTHKLLLSIWLIQLLKANNNILNKNDWKQNIQWTTLVSSLMSHIRNRREAWNTNGRLSAKRHGLSPLCLLWPSEDSTLHHELHANYRRPLFRWQPSRCHHGYHCPLQVMTNDHTWCWFSLWFFVTSPQQLKNSIPQRCIVSRCQAKKISIY